MDAECADEEGLWETKDRALWEDTSVAGGLREVPGCPPVPHCPARALLLALVLPAVLGAWPPMEGPHGGGLAGSAEARVWGRVQGGSLLIGTQRWVGSETRKTHKPH